MEKMIKILVLTNNQILISQIEEVGADLGEPDCKLIKPFELKKSTTTEVYLESWNSDYTSQDTFMISSEKIITLIDPKPTLIEKYQNLIK
jgi:hypothetical protein